MSPPSCPSCGLRPCRCREAPDGGAVFSLLPCPGERAVADEERFTRLLREVKDRVVRREFVQAEEGRPLLDHVRRLGRLVDENDVAGADRAAGELLQQVLEFPPRPRRRVARWIVAGFALASLLAFALLRLL